MGEDAVNDDSPRADDWEGELDPSGQAAILLVESLIHGLVSKSVLSVPDAVEIVDIAADVGREVGPVVGQSETSLRKSLAILNSIGDSLRIDLEATK
jgi:hypothetical protein